MPGVYDRAAAAGSGANGDLLDVLPCVERLVRGRELADSRVEGFQELWNKAMGNLREIGVDPRGPTL